MEILNELISTYKDYPKEGEEGSNEAKKESLLKRKGFSIYDFKE